MFAVKFTVGEKRGLESKTNKCVLCYRSDNFPTAGDGAAWLDVPAVCFPKCPGLGERQAGLAPALLPARSRSAELCQPSFHGPAPAASKLCPSSLQSTAQTSPTAQWASARFPGLLLVCCLFSLLSAHSVTLVWSSLIPSVVLFYLFFSYYSPDFICLLAIHLFLCWLLFLQWFLSPDFSSNPCFKVCLSCTFLMYIFSVIYPLK